jgi:uncharacterized protein (TIGR04255 family)
VSESSNSFPFPSFSNPPVVEVICGITFKPIPGLLAPHLGLLWNEFREEYPECKEVDPLVPVIETFDGEDQRVNPFSESFLPRIWFFSKDENGILQLQRDRLLHNWRKVRATDQYPRFRSVAENFQKYLAIFQRFLSASNLGTIAPEQLEMTYLNHIPQGEAWKTLADIGAVFPDFNWNNRTRFLPAPERLNWRTSFQLPNQSGRLHVVIQTAFRRSDRLPMIVVELTVRGFPTTRTAEALQSWYEQAHEWIVKGFADLTSPSVHQLWNRKE